MLKKEYQLTTTPDVLEMFEDLLEETCLAISAVELLGEFLQEVLEPGSVWDDEEQDQEEEEDDDDNEQSPVCTGQGPVSPSVNQVSSQGSSDKPMAWIEMKRLEMGMDIAVEHVMEQTKKLTGKNQQALRGEFSEWIDGNTNPEDQEWMNHNDW